MTPEEIALTRQLFERLINEQGTELQLYLSREDGPIVLEQGDHARQLTISALTVTITGKLRESR